MVIVDISLFGGARLQQFVPAHRLRGGWRVRDLYACRSCSLSLCGSYDANSTIAGLLMVFVTRSAVLIAVGVGLAAFLTVRKHLRGYRITVWRV